MTKTWDFLTRIQGGVWYDDVITKKLQLASQWNTLVDTEANPTMFEKYFQMSHDQDGHEASTSLLDLRRYCVFNRDVIKDFFDQSGEMQKDYLVQARASSQWPSLEKTYARDSTTLTTAVNLCTGISLPRCTSELAICGCTHVYNTMKDMRSIDVTPLTLAVEYMKKSTEEAPLVGDVTDFINQQMRPEDAKIPVFRYTRTLKKKTDQYIQSVTGAGKSMISEKELKVTRTNFKDLGISECARINFNNAAYINQTSCFSGLTGIPDPAIAAAEESWLGKLPLFILLAILGPKWDDLLRKWFSQVERMH